MIDRCFETSFGNVNHKERKLGPAHRIQNALAKTNGLHAREGARLLQIYNAIVSRDVTKDACCDKVRVLSIQTKKPRDRLNLSERLPIT